MDVYDIFYNIQFLPIGHKANMERTIDTIEHNYWNTDPFTLKPWNTMYSSKINSVDIWINIQTLSTYRGAFDSSLYLCVAIFCSKQLSKWRDMEFILVKQAFLEPIRPRNKSDTTKTKSYLKTRSLPRLLNIALGHMDIWFLYRTFINRDESQSKQCYMDQYVHVEPRFMERNRLQLMTEIGEITATYSHAYTLMNCFFADL